jgi:hypothetical protein
VPARAESSRRKYRGLYRNDRITFHAHEHQTRRMQPKRDAACYTIWLELVWEALAEQDPENREAKLQAARLFLCIEPTPAPQH